jgi:nicotinamide riboside kinase
MRKIIVTGPESSGKTTLARMLAAHYEAPLVDEQARAYLHELGRPYVEPDLLAIAQQQWVAEEKGEGIARETSSPLVICDTDLLTIRIWALVKFGRCDPWITKMLVDHKPDHSILCSPDIPWEPDPLREDPHGRDQLFAIHEQELNALNRSCTVVHGDPGQRLRMAIAAVDALLDV